MTAGPKKGVAEKGEACGILNSCDKDKRNAGKTFTQRRIPTKAAEKMVKEEGLV